MSTESINTFNNVGKKWSDEDIELLKINYTDNNLSVHKLSIMCHRTMYAILCQLKKLNIIENLENANGYNEYIDLRDTEKEKLNDIKNNIFKNDYLENNLSIDELSSKYNLSNKTSILLTFAFVVKFNNSKPLCSFVLKFLIAISIISLSAIDKSYFKLLISCNKLSIL